MISNENQMPDFILVVCIVLLLLKLISCSTQILGIGWVENISTFKVNPCEWLCVFVYICWLALQKVERKMWKTCVKVALAAKYSTDKS